MPVRSSQAVSGWVRGETMAGFIPQSVLVQAMGAWIDHSERRFYSASAHGKSWIWPHGILRVDLERFKAPYAEP